MLSALGGDPADLPPFDVGRLVTESRVDPLLAVALVLAAGLYLWGVRELRSRGDQWPVTRTAAWTVGGLGTIAVATMSGLGAYDETLFSTHMVQHMVLSMVSPVFLALGAPVTLALRTLPAGGRHAALVVLHSRLARVLTFPPVGWLLFVGSPFALYFSGWYPATLEHPWLHELLHLHFLVVGSLFFWPLIGLDPVPGRVPHPLRFLLVFAALPIHAILGLTIMNSSELIAGPHYLGLGLTWSDPASDQRVGGGLLWASGDLVGLLMLGAVVVQWMRASDREAARIDRQLDREQRARVAAGTEGAEDLLQPVWWAAPRAPTARAAPAASAAPPSPVGPAASATSPSPLGPASRAPAAPAGLAAQASQAAPPSPARRAATTTPATAAPAAPDGPGVPAARGAGAGDCQTPRQPPTPTAPRDLPDPGAAAGPGADRS
ncbi:MAG TPA: cytochrome c oxidase assembly protein [Mycobacteriales bacterium]|nr:cytochrome c oxidase assembly protein [Mycobacteriales bacterium]